MAPFFGPPCRTDFKEGGTKMEGMRKNKGKEQNIVVPQNLILLSLLLYTSDIHAPHTLMYNTPFYCPPLLFCLGRRPCRQMLTDLHTSFKTRQSLTQHFLRLLYANKQGLVFATNQWPRTQSKFQTIPNVNQLHNYCVMCENSVKLSLFHRYIAVLVCLFFCFTKLEAGLHDWKNAEPKCAIF